MDSDSREQGEDSPPDPAWGGEIELWKSIGRGFEGSGIQDFEDNIASCPAVPEKIEAWAKVGSKKTRQALAQRFMWQCIACVLIGALSFSFTEMFGF